MYFSGGGDDYSFSLPFSKALLKCKLPFVIQWAIKCSKYKDLS